MFGERTKMLEQIIADHRYRLDDLKHQHQVLREDHWKLEEELKVLRGFIDLIAKHFGVEFSHVPAHWKIFVKGGPEIGC